MRKSRRGFTLIELLVVVTLIGILALIALPKFTGTRKKAYRSQMQADLRTLVNSQEAYFDDAGAYTDNLSLLTFNPTPTVTIQILETNGSGWSAKATHLNNTTLLCGIYLGSVTPPPGLTLPGEGVVGCN